MKKTWTVSLLSIANLALLLFLVLKYGSAIQWQSIVQAAEGLPGSLLLLILGLNGLLILLYGLRLAALSQRSIGTGFSIAAVGYSLNHILPFRLGELFRIYFAQKKYGISASLSLLCLLYERLTDLFFLGLLALVYGFASANQLGLSPYFMRFALLIPLASAAFLYLLSKSAIFQKTSFLRQRFQNYFERFTLDLKKQVPGKTALYLCWTSLAIWLLTPEIFALFFQSGLADSHFTFLDAIGITLASSLSLAFSTLPAGLGLFEASIAYYLCQFKGVEQSQAISLALLIHALILIPQMALMFYHLYRPRKIAASAYQNNSFRP